MAEDHAGAGGGGAPYSVYDYPMLRAAVMADSESSLGAIALTWEKMYGVLNTIQDDLGSVIEGIEDALDTQHVGPAFAESLRALGADLFTLAVDSHGNALTNNHAAMALRAAQAAIADLDSRGPSVNEATGKDARAAEAGRVANHLNNTYGDAIKMLVIPGDHGYEVPGPPGNPGGAPPNGGPGSGAVPLPTGGGPSSGTQSSGSLPVKSGPPSGGRVIGALRPGGPVGATPPPGSSGGVPALGSGKTEAGAKGGGGSGSGSGAGRRVQVPGGRGPGPIGGSQIPAARGGSLAPPGTPTPGTAGPGGGGPGGPGRVPPMGGVPGGGAPGDGRRGRRLTWYERIEDEFVDQRVANPPGGVTAAGGITEQSPDPGPAVIGTQKQPGGVPEANPDAWAVMGPAVSAPTGFPDKLENGAFAQPDGTRFQVRRRSGA
ncbi:MAG: hypothetical protein ACRDT6_27470 [Micromonosporaceae bacterium]